MLSDFSTQKGFTLIELMIAITLGLLISAAALMIFLSSQRNLAMQAGMGDIQQSTIFGLSSLTHDLRHANLDTGFDVISSGRSTDGIDLSQSSNAGNKATMQENSDVLTIRYHARDGYNTDCAGTTNIATGTAVTHRYYIDRLPNRQQSGGTDRYGLMCQSGVSPNPAIVIPDAESFKISFLTRSANGTPSDRTDDLLSYDTLEDHLNGIGGTITAIEVGVVIRSSNSVQADSKLNQTSFTIAGQPVTLSNNDNRHLRTAITQVVALRNAQGLQ